ncbi:GNAT family N-acetyltransferase [Hymenobacter volaticus]|uniref:GNAT family N-acetyltransferase n=1 Tax=Hymenobacter volaticus TaxID=2932254 RepID=A0ABY4G4W4_9BACT|nr:GNAT family N-acetyltransferase [Hymenobacter volaticus]UOQ65935.1 GNAT family N-acetyltransferase [Hymenobacter volaticus]
MSDWKDTLQAEPQDLKASKPESLVQLARRPATAADFEVTLAIKKQALGPYIEQVWGWEDEFQRVFHSENFKPDSTTILLYEGKEIGLLEAEEQPDCFFIQSLLIVPEFQGRGVGTALLNEIITKALAVDKPVRLDVLQVNKRALQLYQRLGFTLQNTTELTFQLVLSTQHEVSNS